MEQQFVFENEPALAGNFFGKFSIRLKVFLIPSEGFRRTLLLFNRLHQLITSVLQFPLPGELGREHISGTHKNDTNYRDQHGFH